jgi:hypothetical protein
VGLERCDERFHALEICSVLCFDDLAEEHDEWDERSVEYGPGPLAPDENEEQQEDI